MLNTTEESQTTSLSIELSSRCKCTCSMSSSPMYHTKTDIKITIMMHIMVAINEISPVINQTIVVVDSLSNLTRDYENKG